MKALVLRSTTDLREQRCGEMRWPAYFTFSVVLASTHTAWASEPAISAYQALAKEDLRLAIVGHRLASANAPFCQRTNRNPGWVLHDKAQYPDADTAQAAFGFRAPVSVSAVIPGGTAEALGVKAGDGITAINGAQVSDPLSVQHKHNGSRLENLQKTLSEALDSSGAAKILLVTAEGQKQIVMSPPAICTSRFWVDTKSSLDAGADGVSVRVTEGLMTFVAHDDSELAAIIAHEMSHNLLEHRQRLAVSGKSKKLILKTEIEADRLSVWLMANAGYDPAAALRFTERYGRKTGLGIFSDGTHLRWKNRQRIMQQELAFLLQTVAVHGVRLPPQLAPTAPN